MSCDIPGWSHQELQLTWRRGVFWESQEDEEKQAVSGAVSWGCVVAQDEGRLEEG